MMQVQWGTLSGTQALSMADGCQAARKVDLMSIELWRTRPYTNPVRQVIDRMFEQTFAQFTAGTSADGGSTGYQSLPVNVWETEDAYYAALMAPGLDEHTINVTFHEDTLAIEGTLAFQAPDGSKIVWQEFNPGPAKFRR